MSEISKGVACRICRNSKDGICERGQLEAVSKKDECWFFEDKSKIPGLAEHSVSKGEWHLN